MKEFDKRLRRLEKITDKIVDFLEGMKVGIAFSNPNPSGGLKITRRKKE